MFLTERIHYVFILHLSIVLLQLDSANRTKIARRNMPYAKKEGALARLS